MIERIRLWFHDWLHLEEIRQVTASEIESIRAEIRLLKGSRDQAMVEISDLGRQLEQIRLCIHVAEKPKPAPTRARNWREVQAHMAGE